MQPERSIRPGDRVVLKVLPPWVGQLPKESQEVFAFCVGRTFRVSEIDRDGLLVLDVSAEVDRRFGGYGNDIRVEPEFVSRRPGRRSWPAWRSIGAVLGLLALVAALATMALARAWLIGAKYVGRRQDSWEKYR